MPSSSLDLEVNLQKLLQSTLFSVMCGAQWTAPVINSKHGSPLQNVVGIASASTKARGACNPIKLNF